MLAIVIINFEKPSCIVPWWRAIRYSSKGILWIALYLIHVFLQSGNWIGQHKRLALSRLILGFQKRKGIEFLLQKSLHGGICLWSFEIYLLPCVSSSEVNLNKSTFFRNAFRFWDESNHLCYNVQDTKQASSNY